jgi:hypothetical protein
MSEQLISEMTAEELRAISSKLNAYVEFAMDGFWFISTLNHWFGL